MDQNPAKIDETPMNINESPIKPTVLENPSKIEEEKLEGITFNQSPKAVREYQIFENFEDP
jgi:hypothetical protein